MLKFLEIDISQIQLILYIAQDIRLHYKIQRYKILYNQIIINIVL